jgi:predicted DCC family thiol-disulfide oxidoreductase YuxK
MFTLLLRSRMKNIWKKLEAFFFSPISASGFGLMRITWALTGLISVFLRWPDFVWLYTDKGVLPRSLIGESFGTLENWSVLLWVDNPTHLYALGWILVVALIATALGWKPRWAVLVSLILLTSFHNRNVYALNGGDRVIRIIGFFLLIAPELRAFSVERLRTQWKSWEEKRALLAPLKMSIWPYRLLLWQLILTYVTTGISKYQSGVWAGGQAVAIALHHTHFARFSRGAMDVFSLSSPVMSVFTLLFDASWGLLLFPKKLVTRFAPTLASMSLKRTLIVFGTLFFHGGIFVLMDVGTFSIIMLVAYCGLLIDDDFRAIRAWFNRRWKSKPIALLYDGHCILCRRSVFTLLLLDHLKRIRPVDFRDSALHKKEAPDIPFAQLDRAMHIRFSGGRTEKGFDAFRALCWHLPVLIPLAPFLYIPGVPPIGRRVYERIAANRDRCADGVCRHIPKR